MNQNHGDHNFEARPEACEQGHGHGEHNGCDHRSNPWETRSLVASGVLVGLGVVVQWTKTVPAPAAKAILIAAIAAGGWMLLPGAWAAVRRLRPNISLLMVIAVAGAAVIGEWA